MVVQKEFDLTVGLSEDKEAVVSYSDLTPEYSTISLNLVIDRRRYLQALLNKKLLWSAPCWVGVLTISVGYGYFKMADYFRYVPLQELISNNNFRYELISTMILAGMVFSVFFALSALKTEYLRADADKLVDESEKAFGFDLKAYSNLPVNTVDEYKALPKSKKNDKELELLENGKNSQIVIYRETPIAVISLVVDKDPTQTNDSSYIIRIQSFGIRRVYVKSGIMKELLIWALFRTRAIVEDLNASEVLVLCDLYSFEKDVIPAFQELTFKKINSSPLKDWLLGGIYGVTKDTWAIGLLADVQDGSSKEAEPIDSKATDGGLRKRN
ncbi:BA75_04757T0 [Komagataella pastoris]|uniref:BA75_04757T0 n=1 Tax=Komagataella pastoris TaxID=4922 RepID=A0A1B2JID9_PICPA|nr:BA75_04757T0 [Komagataella pastoris]